MRPSSQAPASFLRKLDRMVLGVALAAAFAPAGLANPVDPTVASGSATFSASGNTLTVTNTPGTIINWPQFNIDQNEITKFIQQSAQSTVLNRITGQDPSQILGTLQSNGRVFLLNPNGILFGQNAVIDVFGLVASNLNISNADFLAGRFNFSGGGVGAVVNQGAITTPVGGSVYLIGSEVRNEGIVTSPKGEVLLAAGSSVSLADTGTPSMSVTLTAGASRAVNLGTVTAEGGRIDIYGALIDQQGVLRADSAAVDEQGRIVLRATGSTTVSGEISATNAAGKGGEVRVLGDQVALTSTAKIDVSGATGGGTVLVGGDYQGKNAAIQNATTTAIAAGATIKADALNSGNGGRVIVWANDKTFYDGFIAARGGANGGDGGFAETSGHALSVTGRVDTLAPRGNIGMWLLDPAGICISNTVCSASLRGIGVTYDTTITSAALDTALATSNVRYSATDFLVYELTYTTASGRSPSFEAPYIYFNGSLSASGLSSSNGMDLKASGTSATLNAAGGSGRIDFSATAALTLSGGGGLRIDATTLDFTTGTSINVGTGGMNLRASSVVQVTGTGATPSFTAKEMEIETSKITGQIAITADYLKVAPWAYKAGGTTKTYVGLANTDPLCNTALCILNQLTGTGVSDGLEIIGSGDLYVVGSFNNPAKRLALIADHGTLYLNAALSVTGKASEPVATILGAEKGFVNNAGANAITTTNGHWVIIAPNQASLTAGGLTAGSQLALKKLFDATYTDENAFWNALMAALNPAATLGNVFGYWNTEALDPCQINPVSCAPAKPDLPDVVDQTVVADTSGTKGDVTYEEKLVVAEKPKAKEDDKAKEGKEENEDKKAGDVKRADAKDKERKGDGLRRAREEDERKSPAELKEEAKQARADGKKSETEARKLEAEAKKAETDARKAEAEARTGKAEDRKADAESHRHHAESKKAEAESKKAEAGSHKAEAEAKEAAAEAREAKTAERKVAAERKVEEKRIEAVVRKADAAVQKVKAEEKKLLAEARKAEAIAKRAEHKAGAEAKKAEAIAKRAEAERKSAERREDAARSFARVVAGQMSSEKLAAIIAQRHAFKTETLAPALSILERNPKVADMPICTAGGSDVCVPARRAAPSALPAPPTPTLSFLPQIQRKVAVIIGIDKYKDPAVPPLESAVHDAQAIGDLLGQKFGYEVRMIPNATRADIVKGINAASRSVGADDSVTVYYAGHGYLMEKNNTGYWIPSDGSVKDPSGWINNDDIARMLNGIPARQVMLVSDSCYSGTLAREAKVTPAGSPAEILGKRSVIVMSSGGEEPVSDEGKEGHSIFAWSLMNALKGIDGVEAGSKAFENTRGNVVSEFPQVPQYGAATSAGHAAGGDYLFEVRSYK